MRHMEELVWMAIGAGLGVLGCIVRNKFMVIEYKICELEGGHPGKTDAQGVEGDPEEDDVRGNIGFRGNK
jgi:hypothetical protein